jgi:Cu+-exporting ATPase
MALPDALASALEEAEQQGRTAITIGWDGQVRGLLTVADALRPTSAQAVAELRELGLTPVLLTGDSRAADR